METFNFPFHTFKTEYPESGTRVQLGGGYVFSSPPNGPDLRRISLSFPTMLYIVSAEPTSTNSIPNNTNIGAPTTMPSGWSVVNPTGGTVTAITKGFENNIPYVDIRITGNTSSNGAQIFFTAFNQTAAVAVEAWTASVYAKYITTPPTAAVAYLSIRELNSSASAAAAGQFQMTGIRTSNPLDMTRATYTRTLTNVSGTTAFVQSNIEFTWTAGQAVDFIVRLGGVQLEKRSSATSLILTRGIVATRTFGKVDESSQYQYNMGALEAFYNRHKLWKNFIYPHPVYGDIVVQFQSPLKIPEGKVSGGGTLGDFMIELVETIQ